MITISETTARTVRQLMRERVEEATGERDFDKFFYTKWADTIIEYVLSDNYECLKEFLRRE